MNIHKEDQVKILSGKDRGKSGKVLKVFPKENRIIIDGLNIYMKKVRPKRGGQKGEIVSIARPMNVSNVAIVCSSCKKQTRTGNRLEGVSKVRYCKKCKATL